MEEEYTEKLKSTLSDVQRSGEAGAATAKQETHQLAEQAKERLDAEVTARKGMVAKELGYLGSALHKSAQEMEQHESSLTEPLRQVASFCQRSSDSVSRKGTRELVSQVESFGREQPLLFFGAALAAGFLATRILRSDVGKAQGQGTGRTGELETETTVFERQEGEATLAPSPAVPTSETLDISEPPGGQSVPGPLSEGERPYGTT
jgi:ElaB/YqjD/DUF883 family membrane-anchored ribosome-binding protein